ncbi:hypothetical protein ACU4GD_15130 [Cupriavidus basilensis]
MVDTALDGEYADQMLQTAGSYDVVLLDLQIRAADRQERVAAAALRAATTCRSWW